VRILHKDIVIIGVIFLAIGLAACLWSEPTKFGCAYEQPYGLTGVVLVLGGIVIATLGFLDPRRKHV